MPREVEGVTTDTLYGLDGEMLTLAGDLVQRWKECFKGLLYPAALSSAEEAEVEDSCKTYAEVTKAVRKLLGSKALGVEELHLKCLGSLNVHGLLRLTLLLGGQGQFLWCTRT